MVGYKIKIEYQILNEVQYVCRREKIGDKYQYVSSCNIEDAHIFNTLSQAKEHIEKMKELVDYLSPLTTVKHIILTTEITENIISEILI